jgi:hypothetical protein
VSLALAACSGGSDSGTRGSGAGGGNEPGDAASAAPDARGSTGNDGGAQSDADGATPAPEDGSSPESSADATAADAAPDVAALDAGLGDAGEGLVLTNLDDHLAHGGDGGTETCATAGGHTFCGGSCNGSCAGSKAVSTYSVATGTASPSEDGSSTRVDVDVAGSDTLEWVKVDPSALGKGPHAAATHFRWSVDVYPTQLTHVQAYEFDLFFGSAGTWLMMGTQCDLASGNWNGWNQATGHWVSSQVDGCGGFFQPNAWNHVVMAFHRDPGPVTTATQYYYDELDVNGVSHAWGLAGFTGTDNQWGDVVGVQVQQDLTSSFTGTLTTYYDSFVLEIAP